jgi:glutathionyl-hydroquinone reductase
LQLKGLQSAITVCAVVPRLGEPGWRFSGKMQSHLDTANSASYMPELYTLADPE